MLRPVLCVIVQRKSLQALAVTIIGLRIIERQVMLQLFLQFQQYLSFQSLKDVSFDGIIDGLEIDLSLKRLDLLPQLLYIDQSIPFLVIIDC